jgi:hypothetical protein
MIIACSGLQHTLSLTYIYVYLFPIKNQFFINAPQFKQAKNIIFSSQTAVTAKK